MLAYVRVIKLSEPPLYRLNMTFFKFIERKRMGKREEEKEKRKRESKQNEKFGFLFGGLSYV